jgi:hypothetical protein
VALEDRKCDDDEYCAFGSCFDVQKVNRIMLWEVMNIFNCFVCLEVPAGVTGI